MSQEEAEYLIDLLIEHAPQHTALDRFAADAPDAVNSPGESEPLRKLKYQYAVRQVIATYFDIHDMEVTARDLQQDLMGIVSDFTLESSQSDTESDVEEDSLNDERAPAEPFFPVAETVEEHGRVEVFESKINSIKEDIGRADTITFTVWFPWHIRWEDPPNAFHIYDLVIEPANTSEWRPRLEAVARDPDAHDGQDILVEIDDGEYDIWRTTLTATSPAYAFIEFKNALQLLSAKINHAHHYLDMGPLGDRDRSSSRLTGVDARWTAIRKPFAMFWEDDRTEETVGTDYGFHGCHIYETGGLPEAEIDYSSIRDRFEQLQSFGSGTAGDNTLLHNALIEYQEGLTSTSYNRSFFNFWRVVEELTMVGREGKQEVIDRALFALGVVTSGDYDPIIGRIAEEIWTVRNDWVHDPGWDRVAEDHEVVAKRLADVLIELHITEFQGLSEREIRRIMKWGVQSETKRMEIETGLRTVSNLTSD
ncbi:hypothetical protein ACOZ4L_16575 (plasmid) [Haloplanus ruber]|uniref:Apea-like HEPN domain-containing protein n=1 Tax=Haloplanus ruber TaxID=869892 RepID=A0ABD6D1M6_9EURY|nr:hypothetical protein [Haloplanus ruber]